MKEKEKSVQEIVERIMGRTDVSADLLDMLIYHLGDARKEVKKKEEERKKQEEERKKKEAEEQKRKQKEEENRRIDAITAMELPLDYENLFCDIVQTEELKAENAGDGLILSLTNLGRVDIEYISALTNLTPQEVISDLKGAIFQNPETWNECFYKGWETADEYLSGNLARKLRIAKEANRKFRSLFIDNIQALSNSMPQRLEPENIFITLGSPWVPAKVIKDFIAHLVGYKIRLPYYEVIHDEKLGVWEITPKPQFNYYVRLSNVYGTKRMNGIYIIEKTLNMKTIAITDEVPCSTTKSGVKSVINQDETAMALEVQRKIIADFQKWVWQDDKRKETLLNIFEERYGSYLTRKYDGSFLSFPGINPSVNIYPYQRNAVARILFNKNTLLAHDVGSGKTYIMVCAGMELKRIGLSKKNLYAVPNNIVGQWSSVFKSIYPNANILVVEPKNFTPAKRRETLLKIRFQEYDAIIMAHSCFDMITMSLTSKIDSLKEEREVLRDILLDKNKSHKGVEKQIKKINEELVKLELLAERADEELSFDKLGIERLFVDEAHYYKNVPVETKMDKVLGISSSGSKKCSDMLEKVKFIQKNGGGVIMATGTPITNSVSDVFVFQQYLQSAELALLDVSCFDAWVGMFAERSTEFEIDVDTSSYRLATRLSKFHNLPELTALLSSVSDFHKAECEKGIPEFNGYIDCTIPRTSEFRDYLKDISKRADDVRSNRVSRKDDNMLKITGDGRRAALDSRLVDATQPFTYQSKVARCAEIVSDIYAKTEEDKLTQLVFIDSSTPKDSFNIYDEFTRVISLFGVPRNEIAYVHDADTDKKRDELFEKVRKGEIRILMGSTFKLGVGVNVQNKLIAIHHLDVPWRPADMVQREGRLIRPGNENKEVFIYRYVTEGSFDAYSWQLLETKQRFITELLSGSIQERSGSDVDDTVLSYAEVKALAVGNPLIKERVEVCNSINRLSSIQRKNAELYEVMSANLVSLPDKIKTMKERLKNTILDYENSQNHPYVAEKDERDAFRARLVQALKDNQLKVERTTFEPYRGFNIVLPENMLKEKPYVLLENNTSYFVEMGYAEKGVQLRLDNFIDEMPKLIQRLTESVEKEEMQLEKTREELANTTSYYEEIEKLKVRLEEIDKKLKVK